jgi:hypothetical protein
MALFWLCYRKSEQVSVAIIEAGSLRLVGLAGLILQISWIASQSTASAPDFFGVWNHPSFPWYEPPASGPGPVTNRSRWPYIVNR